MSTEFYPWKNLLVTSYTWNESAVEFSLKKSTLL